MSGLVLSGSGLLTRDRERRRFGHSVGDIIVRDGSGRL